MSDPVPSRPVSAVHVNPAAPGSKAYATVGGGNLLYIKFQTCPGADLEGLRFDAPTPYTIRRSEIPPLLVPQGGAHPAAADEILADAEIPANEELAIPVSEAWLLNPQDRVTLTVLGTTYRLRLHPAPETLGSDAVRSDIHQIVGLCGYYTGLWLDPPHPLSVGSADPKREAEFQQGVLNFQFDSQRDVNGLVYDHVHVTTKTKDPFGNDVEVVDGSATRARREALDMDERAAAAKRIIAGPPSTRPVGARTSQAGGKDEAHITLYPFADDPSRPPNFVTQRVALARFARAVRGPARSAAPDLDARGYRAQTDPDDLSPARGPSVGMTLGGAIRVRLVRDRISAKARIFVHVREVSATASSLAVEGAIELPVEGPSRDLVLLRSTVKPRPPQPPVNLPLSHLFDPKDFERADAAVEEKNERALARVLEAERKRIEKERELTANKLCKEAIEKQGARHGFQPVPGETALDCFRGSVPAWRAEQVLRISDPLDRDAWKNVLWVDRASAELDALDDQIAILDEMLGADRSTIGAIVAGTAQRTAHWQDWVKARRAAAKAKAPDQFVVEARLGKPTGPIIAELGVIAFPPLDVEIAAHMVSIGPRGGNDLHHNVKIESLVAPVVACANAILAQAGVRLRVRTIDRYRVADKATEPSPADPLDDDGLNIYLENFSYLFPEPGVLPFVENNVDVESGREAETPRGTPPGRRHPDVNVVMRHYADGYFNVYVVSRMHYAGVGLGTRRLEAPAQTARLKRVESVARVAPRNDGRDDPWDVIQRRVDAKNTEDANPPETFDMPMTEDRVGLVLAYLRGELTDWLMNAATLTHEFGHVLDLAHYRGGEGGTPPTLRQDLWAHKNVMFNAGVLFEQHLGSTIGGAEVDYGTTSGDPFRGGCLYLKKEQYDLAVPTPTPAAPYSPLSNQVILMRNEIVLGMYHGHFIHPALRSRT